MRTIPSDMSQTLRVGAQVTRVYYCEPGHGVTAIGVESDTLDAALDAALERRANDPNYDRPCAGSPGLTLGDTTPIRITRRVLVRYADGGACDDVVLTYEYSQAEALEWLPRLRKWARA